jgi:hypothetical protein
MIASNVSTFYHAQVRCFEEKNQWSILFSLIYYPTCSNAKQSNSLGILKRIQLIHALFFLQTKILSSSEINVPLECVKAINGDIACKSNMYVCQGGTYFTCLIKERVLH